MDNDAKLPTPAKAAPETSEHPAPSEISDSALEKVSGGLRPISESGLRTIRKEKPDLIMPPDD